MASKTLAQRVGTVAALVVQAEDKWNQDIARGAAIRERIYDATLVEEELIRFGHSPERLADVVKAAGCSVGLGSAFEQGRRSGARTDWRARYARALQGR